MSDEFKRLVPTEVRDGPDGSITIVAVPEPDAATLHTVAMDGVRLLPDEWTVKCVPSGPYPSDDPGNWHSFFSGAGEDGEPVVTVPCPDSPTALFIFLHEIGHVLLGHLFISNSDTPAIIVEQVELSASLWAYSFMLSHNLEVPLISKVLAKAMAKGQGEQVRLAEVGLPPH